MDKTAKVLLLLTIALEAIGWGFGMTGIIVPAFGWTLVGCGGLTLIILVVYLLKKEDKPKQEQIPDIVRQENIKFRENQLEKRVIPDKLFELDQYLSAKVSRQIVSAEKLKPIFKEWIKWYDMPIFIFHLITFASKFGRKLFKKSHINFVIRYATRLNLAFRLQGLGTLRIKETDAQYNIIYQNILQLETGFPIKITTKIHRVILMSITLNCLRLLSPNRSYWRQIEAPPTFEPLLNLLQSSLGIWMMQLDNAMTALIAEVSNDIEGYFRGD